MQTDIYLPANRGFMDDLTVTTNHDQLEATRLSNIYNNTHGMRKCEVDVQLDKNRLKMECWPCCKASRRHAHHNDITWKICVRRQRLGSSVFNPRKVFKGQDRRNMVQELTHTKEERRKSKTIEWGQQMWKVKIERSREKDYLGRALGNVTLPVHLLRSVYDVLPSLSNVLKLDLLEIPDCQSWGTKSTKAHIMSCCKLELQIGWYRRMHVRWSHP